MLVASAQKKTPGEPGVFCYRMTPFRFSSRMHFRSPAQAVRSISTWPNMARAQAVHCTGSNITGGGGVRMATGCSQSTRGGFGGSAGLT